MHSYANFEANVTRSQRGAQFEWRWFNAMFLTPSRVTDEIHEDPHGATFLLNVIAPELVKSFCPIDRPIIVLDYGKIILLRSELNLTGHVQCQISTLRYLTAAFLACLKDHCSCSREVLYETMTMLARSLRRQRHSAWMFSFEQMCRKQTQESSDSKRENHLLHFDRPQNLLFITMLEKYSGFRKIVKLYKSGSDPNLLVSPR